MNIINTLMYNMNMSKKIKKEKKIPKITKASVKKAISKLKKVIMKLWADKVKERDNHACVYCGKKELLNAHHYLSRDIRNSPLKFDIRNGISLCPEHHKFSGVFSSHRSPINFYEWLRFKRPDHYKFVLDNTAVRVDLDDIKILTSIKTCLENGTELDIPYLVSQSTETTTTTTTEASLLKMFGGDVTLPEEENHAKDPTPPSPSSDQEMP